MFHVYFLLMQTWLIYFFGSSRWRPSDEFEHISRLVSQLLWSSIECRFIFEEIFITNTVAAFYFLYLLLSLFSREKRPVDKHSEINILFLEIPWNWRKIYLSFFIINILIKGNMICQVMIMNVSVLNIFKLILDVETSQSFCVWNFKTRWTKSSCFKYQRKWIFRVSIRRKNSSEVSSGYR